MLLFFNSEEVYIGYSMEELYKVRECLAMEHIKYKYKVINTSGHSRGKFGSLGMNMDYIKMYYVYVKRIDYNKAKYLIDKALHRL